MEYSFSKLEIATYLRDFFKMLTLPESERYSDKTLVETLSNILANDNRRQCVRSDYYDDMYYITLIFFASKILALNKDKNFEALKESEISHINWESIFVNKQDYRRFSKKKIINYIRNALVHNKSFRELYQIKRFDDEIKIEINLLNTKPIPFHVIIDSHTLLEIIDVLEHANKIEVVALKSKRKCNINVKDIAQELRASIYYRLIQVKDAEIYSRFKKIQEENKPIISQDLIEAGASYTDYDLTFEQAEVVEEDIKFFSKWIDINNHVFSVIVANSIIPNKVNNMYRSLRVLGNYFSNKESTRDNSIKDIKSKLINNMSLDIQFDRKVLEPFFDIYTEEMLCNVFNIYSQFMFDTLITDQEIECGKYKLDVERMRNSLVHSRWHRGARGRIHFYDWENGEKNYLKPNWKSTFKIADLIQLVDKQYLKYTEGKKIVQDSPIHIRWYGKEGAKEFNDISFIKNGKGYMYYLDDFIKKYKCEKGLYISEGGEYQISRDIEDLKMFLSEMENLNSEDKEKCSVIIEQAKQFINQQIEEVSDLIVD